MTHRRRILDRWNSFLKRIGKNTNQVAREIGAEPHKVRTLMAPRTTSAKTQERVGMLERIKKVIPADEASTFDRMVVMAQAGEVADVVETMRGKIAVLEQENRALRRRVLHLERMRMDATPPTGKEAVRIAKR